MARAVVCRFALLVAVLTSCPAQALAQAANGTLPPPEPSIRTWGGTAETHEVGTPLPPPSVVLPPPPAPRPTLGVPIGETVPPISAPPRPASPASPPIVTPEVSLHEPIVRAPGHIGLRYVLEGIEVRGNTRTLSRVVLRYVPFKVGDPLDVDDKELVLTRFRLLGTGFFRDVQLSLRRGSERGNAVLVVTVVERNTVIVNDLWLGLSTDAASNGVTRPLTAYGGIDVAETNLGGTGITLGGAIAVAEDQLALRIRFADPQFLKTDWSVQGEVLFNDARDFFGNGSVSVAYAGSDQQTPTDYAVLEYQRLGGVIGAGHDLGISTRLNLDYRLEYIDATPPLAASQRFEGQTQPIDFLLLPGQSFLSTLRATFLYDTLDEPFLPTRGTRLALTGEVSLTPLGSDYPYAKVQAHGAHWWKLPWGHVVSFDAFVGGIFGTAPLFEQYYVGDFSDLLPDRVLGLNFDRRNAPNFFNDQIGQIRYGNYAAKLDLGYRLPLYRGTRSIYAIEAFGSVGFYAVASEQNFTSPPANVTDGQEAPIDFTFNLGVQIESSAGGFTFGLSNFLGFIPSYSGGR